MKGVVAAKNESLNSRYVAASVLFHLLLLPFILFWPIPAQKPAPAEESIDVEIVSVPPVIAEVKQRPLPELALSKTRKALPTETQRPETAAPSDPRPSKKRQASVKPTRMLSEEVLADRRSSQARMALAQLAPADQVEQLCNLEAMAQIAQWDSSLQPDRVVAYAMADTKLSENSFSADGAAVHSRQDWYRLRFKCDLTLDHKKVVAFEFTLGEAIPKEIWSEHSLPDEDGSLD